MVIEITLSAQVLEAIRAMTADPTPFPVNAQYQKNMTVEDDATGPEYEQNKTQKKPKPGKKKAAKKSKRKYKRQPSRAKKSTKRQKLKSQASACKPQRKQEPAKPSTNASATYKAGDFCCARDRFLERTRRLLGVSWHTANSMWKQSAERVNYLRTLSLPELKRRRFVPPGTARHPFL